MINTTRRDFALGAAALSASAFAQGVRADAANGSSVDLGRLNVRFLGTGAADWNGPDKRLGHRRRSAVLLDGKILVDFTKDNADMMPAGCRPEVVIYTHSHADHYNPRAVLPLGVRRVYCHESWAEGAKSEFASAAASAGVTAPEVVPLAFGQSVTEFGVRLTSLPSNHCTGRRGEHCSMYLFEKGETRLLYAVDTGGIPGEAARIVGIDAHVAAARPITGLIMEATMGAGHFDDFRIFVHSSVDDVCRLVRVLKRTKRYCPAADGKVYITHMARTLHGTQKEIAKGLPADIVPAYDGLEVLF